VPFHPRTFYRFGVDRCRTRCDRIAKIESYVRFLVEPIEPDTIETRSIP
jgi:hypothetical protein